MNAGGALFQDKAKTQFMTITRDRYNAMAARIGKLYKIPLPFNLAKWREGILDALGDRYDGAIKCRYCGRICTLKEVAGDHAMPLSRGGSVGLDNIDLPCEECNRQKGPMTYIEFLDFRHVLEARFPLVMEDTLLRLQMHSKLLASKRRSEFRIRELEARVAELEGRLGIAPAPKKKAAKSNAKPPLLQMMDDEF